MGFLFLNITAEPLRAVTCNFSLDTGLQSLLSEVRGIFGFYVVHD